MPLGDGEGDFALVGRFPAMGVSQGRDDKHHSKGDPSSLAVGCFNHDLKKDVAVALFASSAVSILLNECTHFE